MQENLTILRDVELRLRALEEVQRLRPQVENLTEQLHQAKTQAAQAEFGSHAEKQYLKEAAEASERLGALRESLFSAERELRRTAYLLKIL